MDIALDVRITLLLTLVNGFFWPRWPLLALVARREADVDEGDQEPWLSLTLPLIVDVSSRNNPGCNYPGRL